MKLIASLIALSAFSCAASGAVIDIHRRGGTPTPNPTPTPTPTQKPTIASFTNIAAANSIVQDAILAVPSVGNAPASVFTFGGKDDMSATSNAFIQSFGITNGVISYTGLVAKVDPPPRSPNFTPPEGANKIFVLNGRIYAVTTTVLNTSTQPIFAQIRVTVFDASTKAQIWSTVLPVAVPGANASGVIAVQDKAGNIYVSYAAGTSNPETTRTAKVTVNGTLAWTADVPSFYPTALTLNPTETTVALGHLSSVKLYSTLDGSLQTAKIPSLPSVSGENEWPQSIVFSSSDIITSTRLGIYVNEVKKVSYTGNVVNAVGVPGGALVARGQLTAGSYVVQKIDAAAGSVWSKSFSTAVGIVGVHADATYAYVTAEDANHSNFLINKYFLSNGTAVLSAVQKNLVAGDSPRTSFLDGSAVILVTLKGAIYRFI
ncbi:hypothetical protein HDU97_008093 [Phlyctochytrium planicorne]|nr:hypothetical protein HDU97_008093 [Phlyctochytrium planicorne]